MGEIIDFMAALQKRRNIMEQISQKENLDMKTDNLDLIKELKQLHAELVELTAEHIQTLRILYAAEVKLLDLQTPEEHSAWLAERQAISETELSLDDL